MAFQISHLGFSPENLTRDLPIDLRSVLSKKSWINSCRDVENLVVKQRIDIVLLKYGYIDTF